MKKTSSIAKKIWFSLSILVSGYLISMAVGFILGQKTESRLRYVSEYLFPASKEGETALKAFNEQIRLYNNAVVTGEQSFIESAKSKAEEVQQALTTITHLKGFDIHKKKEVKAVSELLNDFNKSANETYTKLSAAFEDEFDSSEYMTEEDIEEKAFYLARITKLIQKRLDYFAMTFADDLKKELSDVSYITRQQRYLNMLIFFGVVIVSLSLIAIIIRRSIIRPLMRIVDIAEDITAGKDDIQWLPETHNEIGILNVSLKTMTENLKTAEKKYRSIFKNAVEGIFQITSDGSIININPAMAKIMGYDSAESMLSSGYKISDQTYANPEHRKEVFETLNKQGRILGFETQFIRKDNSPIWVSLSARLVRDNDDSISYFEGSVIDITEHKEKERAELERHIAEESNKKIMSSIQYAKSIQNSLLPNMNEVRTYLPESFFIWEPRDIVSGDIFYIDFFKEGFIIAVIDCTGHGVPGAFMTMIASSGLRRITRDEGCHDPAEILKHLNYIVKTTLQQDREYAVSDDGMDMGVCFVRYSRVGISCPPYKLSFAGAKTPLYYISGNEINVIKGDRQSIGYRRSELKFDFTNHTIHIEEGMRFYMATDGYSDQIGGERERSFGKKQLIKLLKEISHLPFEEQREEMLRVFHTHKGDYERLDDVTVAGFGF